VSIVGIPVVLASLVAGLAVAIGGLNTLGRRRADRWSVRPREDPDDPLSSVRVLDISGIVQGAQPPRLVQP
jgi:hypothetical protein